ncbi:hypothetical protein NEOLEDRAFT_1142039 [Neolentinus lepideus HHB14362 ss-1]|uniref:F-box domain-containing protein n=1 Tax=Neolentinus lepideus HHB14362 ss-1 TaxID=1314782 RepID=A0A165NCQ8_9AGAM|nr:hypothetical protein NEOLEDRAFT_1142039 [Neolentinus lepideus HHB14362 ss-1]
MSASKAAKTEVQQKKRKLTASNAKDALEESEGRNSPGKGRSRQKRNGKLALLPTLPLDVLFEIFGHLLPLDLLHLARITKAFRRILMHRSSKTIWKNALSNIDGLPPCPDDMSEPAYANLAFDLHCHDCDKKNIRNVDFRLRVRYCSTCAKLCLKGEIDEMDERLRKCLIFSDWCGNYDSQCIYVGAHADAIQKELDDLPVEKWEDYIEQKQAQNEKILKHAELCETWEGEVYDKRANEIDQLRAAKREAIIERLTALGWGDEIAKLPKYYDRRYPGIIPLKDHVKVKDTKPLTDRTWLNMKDTMIEYMEKMKQHRIWRQRERQIRENKRTAVSIYRDWRKVQEEKHADLPESLFKLTVPLLEFCEWGPIKQLWHESYEVVDRREFEQVLQEDAWRLDRLITNWRENVTQELVERLDSADFRSLDWSPAWRLGRKRSEDIQLATAVFVCTGNRSVHFNWTYVRDWPKPEEEERLWYPQILYHKCNTLTAVQGKERAATEQDVMLRVAIGYCGYSELARRQKWSCSTLSLDVKASNIVANIVMACGLNPKETTAAEMDKLDPRIVCLKCTYGHECDGERLVQVRTWRNAVRLIYFNSTFLTSS